MFETAQQSLNSCPRNGIRLILVRRRTSASATYPLHGKGDGCAEQAQECKIAKVVNIRQQRRLLVERALKHLIGLTAGRLNISMLRQKCGHRLILLLEVV